MKIGKKLIIMIIAVALSGIGALSTTILTGSQRQISLLINNELRNLAYNEAGKLSLRLESYFSIARSLANSMQGYEQIEPERRRFFYNILLKQLAEANPEAVAIWTCWEPNALDGLDAQYANTRGTDNTGRFIPSWSWTAEGVRLDSVANYGAGGAGDFYRIPMRTGKETIVEPRFQIIDGVNTLITSLCVPIKKNGQCIGVAGVDIALSGIQADIKRINPYKGSIAMVFSNGGLVTG
ncbi:MAG: cache domain-containing protein, partial [Treponema sp.]|nr:cache domain-containing protein [Treponema sp.]